MSKLLLLTLEFPPQIGGIAQYLDAFASSFRDSIEVVAPPMAGASGFDAAAGYCVVRKQLLWRWLWPRWKKMVLYLLWHRRLYDKVVVSHVLPMGTAAWLAKHVTRRPYIVIVHGMDVGMAKKNPWKRRVAGWVLRGAELVVTNSRALERDVQTGFDVLHTQVVYPCVKSVDTPPCPPLGKWGDVGVLTLLTVARLVSRKGHCRVLEALAKLKRQHQLPNVRYRIVGDGPERHAIAREIQRLGLQEIVRMEPGVSHGALAETYASSHVFVMPTVRDGADREGFGLVYIEAAQYGVPSIATDQPGVDEAVLDGKTGLLIPDGDISALAEAIHRLLTDRALREQLGAAGRERVQAEFTAEHQFSALKRYL